MPRRPTTRERIDTQTALAIARAPIDLTTGSSHFAVCATGLLITGEPTLDEWSQFGDKLRTMANATRWAIGDWLLYGEGRGDWGESYAQAIESTGRSYGDLRNAVSISKAFAPERRRAALTWSHHAVVQRFDDDIQERLLDLAVAQSWTTRDLQDHVRDISRSARIAEQPFPTGQYGVLYVDPPWEYDVDPAANLRGMAEAHYPVMSHDDLLALAPRVQGITAPHAVCFMWATSSMLEHALRLLAAWGFTYKTCAVWVKDLIGNGWWFRQRHEILLLGVHGDPVNPSEHDRVDSVIQSPRRAHSQKPDEAYALIETMFPHAPKVELFARERRDGWDAWGNQLDVDRATQTADGTRLIDVFNRERDDTIVLTPETPDTFSLGVAAMNALADDDDAMIDAATSELTYEPDTGMPNEPVEATATIRRRRR